MELKNLFSPHPLYHDMGLGIVRIFTGLFMVYHGWEVFDRKQMNDYSKWMADLKFFAPSFIAYLGKGIEFVSGILISLGLFTRIAAVPLAITMGFICFILGEGRIFTKEQHAFLFVLLSLLFLFCGPGKWSIDKLLFSKSFNK